MIDSLKPYTTYKDSGIEWLGEVPAHWEVRRGKNLFRPIDVCSRTGDEELLTVSSERGIVPRASANVTMFKAESYVGYKLCWPDDLVVNSLWAWARGLGVSRYHGIVSSAYGIYRLLPNCKTHSQFVHNLVRSVPFQWELQVRSKGIWVSRLQLTDEAFLGALFPLPPFSEQTAIVRFLDHANRRIQRYIRAKQKLIALLEEQKQVIIHQAVTGQIDVRTGQPYPAYQLFGTEWLGKVPNHWEVVRLRRVTRDRCDGPFGSGLKSSHYTEGGGIRVVRLQNIGHGEFKDSDAAFISLEHYASLGDHSVVPGDVLIAGLGDNNHPAGRACVAPENIAPAMVKADCFRFRLNQARVHSRFVALQLTATATVTSAHLSTGATRQRTNLQSASTRPVAFPAIREQDLIVEYVSVKTSEIRAAQDAAQREIDLLNDFRTRLVADIVTGKLDVREAAAVLPEVDPLETDHDLDGMAEATDLPRFEDEEDVVRLRD